MTITLEEFDQHPINIGLRDRFIDHKEWTETRVYNHAMERIGRGELVQGSIRSEKKLMNYLAAIDRLYDSIKEYGYRPDVGVTSPNGHRYESDPYNAAHDHIVVNLDRHGRAIFFDGIHRLSIARILAVEKITISVIVRHKEWKLFRNRLRSYTTTQGGSLYQPAYHFDLEDIPYEHGSKDRFETIRDHTNTGSGTVLDIGANLGYFCHRFENIGFHCTGIEVNPQEAFFMKGLKKANRDSFDVFEGSIIHYKSGEALDFDIVLALNIFHHFLKREGTYGELKNLLLRINSRELFFETHNPKEKQMRGAYRNYAPAEFARFVLDHSCFTGSELLQEMETGRKLYRLFA